MKKHNSLNRIKSRVLSRIMNRARSFNEKHRGMAKATTVAALSLVVIVSILFQIVSLIVDLYMVVFGTWKKKLAALMVAVLILAVAIARNWDFSNIHHDVNTSSYTTEVEETAKTSIAQEPEQTEAASEPGSTDSTESQEQASSVSEPESTDDQTQAISASEPTKDWNTSGVDLNTVIAQFPEAVAWIYFEDGHISYPIMQADDNEKYVHVDENGEDSRTGAIFLDSRSAADFSDSNSIVYGHNMKDRTMFGSLRDYREDPHYYDNHQYFQIITPQQTLRYLIFEYMDVPENDVMYDYVGEAALEFVKDAEPIRRRSYMDSEIIVDETKRVVTLSTCTAKDERQFLVMGGLVDAD